MQSTAFHPEPRHIHLPDKYHISILDGDADTCFLGQGWEVFAVHNTTRANVVGFDHEAAVKRNLTMVSAITAIDLLDVISVILIVHKAIYTDTSNQLTWLNKALLSCHFSIHLMLMIQMSKENMQI
jgi:nitrous oxidase accessory protein NosD